MFTLKNSSLCRLCAKIDKDEIFRTEKYMHLNVIDKIFQYFGLNIKENDFLPKHVCGDCFEKVYETYQFHQQIEEAQEILQVQLVNSKSDNEISHNSDEPWYSDDEEPLSNPILMNTKAKGEFSVIKNSSVSQQDANTLINEVVKKIKNNKKYKNDELRKYFWKCIKCHDKLFKTADKLRVHFEDVHKTPIQYICIECSKDFDNVRELTLHVNEHSAQIQSLIQVGDKFNCDICNKEFTSKRNLLQHRFIHLGIKRFSCDECGKSFMQRPHLKNHMTIHTDVTPFSCLQCNKKFKTKNNLHIHNRSHLPKEMRYKYKCNVCEKMFITTSNLKYHRKIHDGVPEFTCEYCGKTFLQKGNLQEHTLTHTNVRPYHCQQCPRTFKNVYRLRQHQTFHSDTKSHICDTCEKKFRTKTELTAHKRVHSGELPFDCEHCGKKFRIKKFLKTHLRQHTGEKPYHCVSCNHPFTNSSNYIKHMRTRHGITNKTDQNKMSTIGAS